MMPASSMGWRREAGHTGQAGSSDCSAMKEYHSWSSKQPDDHLLPSHIPRGSVASFPREQDPRAACLAVASHAVQLPATNLHPTSAPILSRVLRGFPQTTPSPTGLTFLVVPPQSWGGVHTVFHTGHLWALDFCYRSQYHTLWG